MIQLFFLKKLWIKCNFSRVLVQKGFYDYQDGKDLEVVQQRDEKLLKVFEALYK